MDADLDKLQSLVEKSLLRFSNERYWMLETIREYAREQLDEAPEGTDRHARYFLAQLEEKYKAAVPPRAEAQAWYGGEVDNLRAMVDRLSEVAPMEAAGATNMLFRFWKSRGAYAEAGQRLQMLLALDDLTDEVRAEALARLGEMRERLGDLDGAEAAAAEALILSAPATNARVVALLIASAREVDRGNVDDGIRLARQAVHEAAGVDAMTRVQALGDLGETLVLAGMRDEARSVMVEALDDARRNGMETNVAWGAGQLGLLDLVEGDYKSARRALAAARMHARSLGFYAFEAEMLLGLGYAQLGLGGRRDARSTFAELLELASGSSGETVNAEVALAVCGLALSLEPIHFREGARLRGAIASLREAHRLKIATWRRDEELESLFEEPLIEALGGEAYEIERTTGAAMNLEETIRLARSLAGP